MHADTAKIKYFFRMLVKNFDPKICPYCGSRNYQLVERKKVVTALLKCSNCRLNYKYPYDPKEFYAKFYQSDYKSDLGHMVNLPSDSELEDLMKRNFSSDRSFSKYLQMLPNLGKGAKVIDYGCSWGYNVYKLNKEGFDTVGFEISVPRASYGKRSLNVSIATTEAEIRNGNSIFFSNHVIEHLSDIKHFIDLASSKLTDDGFFIAFCPNGSTQYKNREPRIYSVIWGFEHPNHLDYEFAAFAFKNNPYLILTGDFVHDELLIKAWDGKSQMVSDTLDGKELLIIARPNIRL